MNMPFNAYEIEQARRQQKMEGVKRERLADIAKASNTKPSRIVSIINAFQRIVPHNGVVRQAASPISEVVSASTRG